ncbi:hypothetical protein ABEF95_001380 [Exophiala dermatitidis]|uniref:Uncharacterized protein n=2 Tax=Exophiala dermatitidis TaxID=5970 RepID=H6BMR3_EXODN|nr:uncharacterized protein HMPREF1120_00310 [Exophiala dermatitidis NIH/UT8656]EHY52091.1 hypothetical protein HMPREF1120_00310 [Exophiala dermatitidis NIH/UT8656]KAJ4554310.1 hypothetical protein HRR78_002714 [Exophiala dermatitidis]KAJ8992128.1 hypothetical protein HRR80_004024 [Exophiala dermatitidis]
MPLLSSTLLIRTYSLTILTAAYYLATSPAKLLSSGPIWLLGESMSIRPASFALDDRAPYNAAGSRAQSSSIKGQLGGNGESQGERELLTLLALLLVVYAVTQFVFAGDLSLMGINAARLPSSTSSLDKSDSDRNPNATSSTSSSSSSSSSRFAEDLHTIFTAQSRWLTLAGLHVLASAGLVFWIYTFHSQRSTHRPSLWDALTEVDLNSSSSIFGRLANRVTFTLTLLDMLFWGYLWTVLKQEGQELAKTLSMRREAQEQHEHNS